MIGNSGCGLTLELGCFCVVEVGLGREREEAKMDREIINHFFFVLRTSQTDGSVVSHKINKLV